MYDGSKQGAAMASEDIVRHRGRDLFASPSWIPVLEQFAGATGLTVSLIDARGELRAGPFAPNPLAQRLLDADGWLAEGPCAEEDLRLARNAIERGHLVRCRALNALALFAVPIKFDGASVGAAVAGWVFDAFPDPIVCDRLAVHLEIPFVEFWQVARHHAPVGEQKLTVYAGLLSTLANSFLREIANTAQEQEQARQLSVLNDAGWRLTVATSVDEIGQAAADSASELARPDRVRVLVSGVEFRASGDEGDWPEKTHGQDGHRTGILSIPIESGDHGPLGRIDIHRSGAFPESSTRPQLSALASQVAVALQKVHLIEDLEHERASLETANRSLEEADRLKDEFLATVSHELRTPLNAILGWAQIMRSDAPEPTTAQRGAEIIERNAMTQAHLIEDLLDMSRIVTGKLKIDLQPTDPVPAIEAAIEAVSPAAQAKGIAVEPYLSRTVGPVMGDTNRLQQIVWNLLSNAVKFTPPGGRIEVRLSRTEDAVEIAVRDTGLGIPHEFLPHVFERFRQADGSASRSYGGLGLGLAIVRHLTELHGGTVAALSPGEGLGATFKLRLPTATGVGQCDEHAPRPADAASPGPQDDEAPLEGLSILVVDDDADTRDLLEVALARAGAEVVSASSATEALEAFFESPPDLLVADIGMPGEDGYMLLGRIRQLGPEVGGTVPAIALTAYARVEDRIRALRAGFQLHLSKPVDTVELIVAAKSLSGRNGHQ